MCTLSFLEWYLNFKKNIINESWRDLILLAQLNIDHFLKKKIGWFLCHFKKSPSCSGFFSYFIFFKWRKGLGLFHKKVIWTICYYAFNFYRQIAANDLFVLFTDQAQKAIILFIKFFSIKKILNKVAASIYRYLLFLIMKYFFLFLFLFF